MVQPTNKRLVTEASVGAHVATQVTTPGSATATALSATYLDKVGAAATYGRVNSSTGPWSSATTYAAGDQAVHLGRLWTRKVAGSSATFNADNWQFAGRVAGGWGNTAVVFGNSRFYLERVPGTAGGTQQRGALHWANVRLRQRLKFLAYAGISGDTLTGMAARWGTDVKAYLPDIVFLTDAVNDISGGATLQQLKDRYTTILTLNRSIGARTVALTTTPRNTNTQAQRDILGGINAWLVGLNDPDVIAIDVTSAVSAAGTQDWGTNFATDGLHQTRVGAARIGRKIADALAPLVPARSVLPISAGDSTNIATNAFVTGTPGVAVPTGFAVFPVQGSGVTYSIVARTDQQPGNWFQLDTGAVVTAVYINTEAPLGTLGVVGTDKVRAVVEMESDVWTAVDGAGFRLYAQFINGSAAVVGSTFCGEFLSGQAVGVDASGTGDTTTYPLENQPGLSGPVVYETGALTIPAGTATIKLLVEFKAAGKVRLSRFGIMKG